MTDHDRGAYAPQNDAPLAFDPRRAGGRRGPAPITLAVSAFVMVAVFIGVVLLYRSGARHPGAAPQVVGQPVGDLKTAPASSAAASSDSSAGLTIYKTESAPPNETTPAPTFAPGPESPQPRPVAHTPPPAAPVTAAPLRAAEPAPTVPPATAKTTPKVAPKPPPAPAVVASAPTPKAVPKTPPKTPPPAAAVSSAPASTGGASVQIAALPTQAAANQALANAARKAPMAGRTRRLEPVQKNGQTLYRALIGGFASHAEAVSFCAKLKAA